MLTTAEIKPDTHAPRPDATRLAELAGDAIEHIEITASMLPAEELELARRVQAEIEAEKQAAGAAPAPAATPAAPPAAGVREAHLLPASLLVLAFAGIALQALGAYAWVWIGLCALNVVARPAIAHWVEARAALPGESDRRAWVLLASHLLDAALWAGLVLGSGAWPPGAATPLAMSVAAMMLFDALSAPGRTVGLARLLSWCLPVAAFALRAGDSPWEPVGLAMWMLSLAWFNAARPASNPAAPAFAPTSLRSLPAEPHSEGSTRRGVQLAVHAIGGLPMIAIHDGRVFDLNRAAAEMMGRSLLDCAGQRLDELGRIQPAGALQIAMAAADRTMRASLHFAPTVAEGMVWPMRLRVGRSRGGGTIAVLAGDASAASPLATRRDLLSSLPALVWVVDAAGRLVHTQGADPWRWGVVTEARERPAWGEVVTLEEGSRAAFEAAMQQALAGRSTFDVLNQRHSASGGRLVLRSHFVPYDARSADGRLRGGALVMDTIASARELLEVERLRRRKDQYKSLVGASPNLIWSCDARFRFTFVSRRAAHDLYGYGPAELLGRSLAALLDPAADQTAARQALVGLSRGTSLRDFEMSHVGKDGRRIVCALSAIALKHPSGEWAGAIGINVDLTAIKQREAQLAEALRVERSVLDSAGQAIAVVAGGIVARSNDAMQHLLRRDSAQLAAIPVLELFADPEQWREAARGADAGAAGGKPVVREVRVRRRTADGASERPVWCQLTLRAIGGGEYVAALANIDSIRQREAHALHDARHDELTGLANRRLFAERTGEALTTSALRNNGCALVVIDLDGFKQVNDRYGHEVGDVVLKEMALRIQRAVRPRDTVARHGGDEFALLIPDAGERRDIEGVVWRVLVELSRPVPLAGQASQTLSASLGIALAPEHGRDPVRLLKLADEAMYAAKMAGGNRAVFASARAPEGGGGENGGPGREPEVAATAAADPALDAAA